MSEAEAKLLVRKFIEYSNYEGYIDFNDYIANQDIKAIETILQLLEQKDKRIDELEKALVEEDLKHREWRNSMSEEEKKAIKMCRLLLNGDITLNIIDVDGGTAYVGSVNKTYNDDLETVLNLIEKQQTKIKELEADLYIANCTINDYIEERRILKDKIKEELNYCNTSRNQYDKCDLQCKFYEKLLDIMGE